MKTILAGLLSVLLVTTSTSGAELIITFGGSFFEGAPQYEILADDAVIATGSVRSERGDVVAVEVGKPDTMAIRFINDRAGPKGPDGRRPPGTDRNLIIEAAQFRGERLLGKQLLGARGVVKSGEFATVTINQTVDLPFTMATNAVYTLPSAPACPDIDVHLTGYENGKLLPSGRMLGTLDQLLEVPGCSLIITGYSSTSGPAAKNKQAATQRAQAAFSYLIRKGGVFKTTDVAGWGETDLFGQDEADNRRVVVSLR